MPATGCATEGTLEDFTDFTDNVDAQGAVNDGPIADFLPGFAWPGGMIPTNLFIEASLNLTVLLEEINDSPCFSFGSTWMHTRASLSDDSNMDDLIAPEPLLFGNCTASGVKYHDLNADGDQDAGEPGLGGFRIWADYDNDGVLDNDLDAIPEAGEEPFDDTDPVTGAYTITKIEDPSGTYSLREKLVSGPGTDGWICSEPTTTGTTPAGQFPCAYLGHRRRRDADRVRQGLRQLQERHGHRREADRAGRRGRGRSRSRRRSRARRTSTSPTASRTHARLKPGVYTATETVPAGWNLTDITCSGDTIAPNSSDTGNTATFNAAVRRDDHVRVHEHARTRS